MLNLEELHRFQVHIVNHPAAWMTVTESIEERFNELTKAIAHTNGAPNQAVATSIFMRRYGFFIASLFYLKAHNKMWAGR